jgi:hypothetical protein
LSFGKLFDCGGLQLHASAGWFVGSGDNGYDVEIGLNECLQAGNREIGGAEKYNAHRLIGMEKMFFGIRKHFLITFVIQ